MTSTWRKYRKTATVEAKPYEPGDEDGWNYRGVGAVGAAALVVRGAVCRVRDDRGEPYEAIESAYIETLEGPVNIRKGSYICRDADGNRWPVDAETFRKTYEEIA